MTTPSSVSAAASSGDELELLKALRDKLAAAIEDCPVRDLSPLTTLSHLVMPLAILAFGSAGVYTRYIRTGVIGELSSDYVRTALAKGASAKDLPFYEGKVAAAKWFAANRLPLLAAERVVLETTSNDLMELPEGDF